MAFLTTCGGVVSVKSQKYRIWTDKVIIGICIAQFMIAPKLSEVGAPERRPLPAFALLIPNAAAPYSGELRYLTELACSTTS